MTPTELRTAIEALRMSQSAVARCVGIDPRTLRRYLSGALPVPKWVPLALNSLRKPIPGKIRTSLSKAEWDRYKDNDE